LEFTAPFVDMDCTTVFNPSIFYLYRRNHSTPILSGRRNSGHSLWNIDLPKAVFANHPSEVSLPDGKDGSQAPAQSLAHR
jgi:hypothetical protein